jgi:hypothetical protein
MDEFMSRLTKFPVEWLLLFGAIAKINFQVTLLALQAAIRISGNLFWQLV